MSGLIVELCGLPGSGKSTLAGLARTALVERGTDARILDAGISAGAGRPARLARRAAAALAEGTLHPRRTGHAVLQVGRGGQESPRDLVAGLVQWLAVQRLLTQARCRPGVGLVEEGPVQTLWTLALRARADLVGPTRQCLSPAARTDLLVLVECPLDVALERLARRESRHSRTQRLPAGRRRTELEYGDTLLQRLVADAGSPVLCVANGDGVPAADLASRIATAVTAIGAVRG